MKGVFFDLGGTLFSYRNVPRVTAPLLLEAVRRLGLSATREEIRSAYNQATQDMTLAYADREYYLHRDFFHDTFMRFATLLGGMPDEGVHAWYHDAHRKAIVDCLELKPDCLETLGHLKTRGLYLSIVSNIDDDMLEPLVAREALDRYFDHWTSSEAAGSCKPHRRFFEVTLGYSGLSPAEVLFVGDSPEHDVQGASALGMRTALIVDGGMPPPLQTGRARVTPDHTIETLSELRGILPGERP